MKLLKLNWNYRKFENNIKINTNLQILNYNILALSPSHSMSTHLQFVFLKTGDITYFCH